MLRLTAAATALLVAGPAFAGGVVHAPPPPPVVPVVEEDWTGAYAGVQLDYIADGTAEGLGIEFEVEGHLIGIFAGYRYDLGNVVVGGEIDYMIGSGDVFFVGTEPGAGSERDYELLRVGAEVGYDLGDALVYGTVGFADIAIEGNTVSEGTGYFAGIGVDYRVSSAVTVGVEALYHEFDDWNDETDLAEITTIGLNVAYNF